MIYTAIASAHCPNIDTVAKKLASQTRGIRESQMAILDYFTSQMEGTLKDTLSAFKAARLFCPQKVHTMQPIAADLDSLKSYPLSMIKVNCPCIHLSVLTLTPIFAPLSGGGGVLRIDRPGRHVLERFCWFNRLLLHLSVLSLC